MKAKVTAITCCLIALALLAGCGGGEDASAWARKCRDAVADYVEGGGYLGFNQETELELSTKEGTLRQSISADGEIIFPARQRYEYREKASSSLKPGEEQENSFSYLTLDGGRTAYVMGQALATQLGVQGWVHYTPPEGQNRYFDYAGLMERLLSLGEDAAWVGWEEVEGQKCAHISYAISGRELMELRLQENPALEEQYEGLDPDEVLGEITVEVWIAKQDELPRRVAVRQSSTQGDISTSSRIDIAFRAYGEEPPMPIEAPAVFTEAS
ncbi:MAG: hypothetical protein HPY75_00350 [Actinobacteria bacterium]|nr:hypothetical protein [Actinomycetota bacterium]